MSSDDRIEGGPSDLGGTAPEREEPTPVEPELADVVSPIERLSEEELMPSGRGSIWRAPVPETGRTRGDDPYRNLGESAVLDAQLSAAGAPTPPLGIALKEATRHESPFTATAADGIATIATAALLTGDEAPYSPSHEHSAVAPTRREAPARGAHPDPEASVNENETTEPDEETVETAADGEETAEQDASSADAGETSEEGADDAAHDDTAKDDTGEAAGGDGGDGGDGGGGDDGPGLAHASDGKRGPGLLFLLIAGGILGIGIGAVIALVLLRGDGSDAAASPSPTETVTLPAPSPTIAVTPTPFGEDPSDFASALPAAVETYSLVAATELDPSSAPTDVVPAEGWDLEYTDGVDSFYVVALQYYEVDQATSVVETVAGEDAEFEDVLVGDEVVGTRGLRTAEDGTLLVWSNGSAVFILSGPEDGLLGFYDHFGL